MARPLTLVIGSQKALSGPRILFVFLSPSSPFFPPFPFFSLFPFSLGEVAAPAP